ncbi:NAD-dependent epimerase/dehydratase family protein [Lichenifustis flavocetrariae]|uniref:NAD-dependent epimerase/dehydratase family protein n=1 Tax=Lichenifustis flavocetrariae TaxID=2949735 RepID=A0AA41YWA6_9HYPH|nr:NAD-dependent epimerase/dehydratase family protein [Lichenifustis flavocetrariae]MCW6508158.1 NAD-dependent epimerase/dehydratase family protein [Lichenifustis flavocetrariae]
MARDVVLVTGAGGCIAAWVMKDLVEAGVTVVGFDLSDDRRRPRLAMDEAALSQIIWETGDIADGEHLRRLAERHGVNAIIHLAALQVPFCKANPAAGVKVNVLGTVNVLETARALGIKRLAYASSIAIQGMTPDSPWLATLYGAHKACGEAMAQVYWQDWQVPSVGIRPGVVYGPARDQGMSAAPTVAMVAAVVGKPYTVPYTGPFPFLYVREVASAFVKAVSEDRVGAPVFDLNGVASTIESVLTLVREHVPQAEVSGHGASFPFPADLSDAPIREFLGDYRRWSLAEGVAETLTRFAALTRDGRLGAADVA